MFILFCLLLSYDENLLITLIDNDSTFYLTDSLGIIYAFQIWESQCVSICRHREILAAYILINKL